MLKKLQETLKVIGKQITIAFFFSATLTFIVSLFIGDDISLIYSLINKMTIEINTKESIVKFDSNSKTITSQPNYGQKWANINIETINVDAPIYQGDSLKIIKNGVGHFTGSYYPGQGATILLVAHNSKQHFGYLYKLNIGDKIVITTDYGEFTYAVYNYEIKKATDLENNLPIQKEKEILVLYTCYPTGGVGFISKRYVVYAQLVGVS